MDKHKPRKRFGQNFLHDRTIINRIISVINPSRNEYIIEIGPGQGALTLPLLQHLEKLTVIELDRDLIQSLKEKTEPLGELQIINQDVLNVDFSQFESNSLRIIGNLPYNISTPLLFHLFEQDHLIHDMIFMLQKEVVERLAASVGDAYYSRLSVMAQYHCHVEKLFDVAPGAFFPAPKVMSSIVKMEPRENKQHNFDENLFSELVKQSFGQRRKMLRNNLSGILSDEDFINLELSSKLRAQELSLDNFIAITRYVQSLKNNDL